MNAFLETQAQEYEGDTPVVLLDADKVKLNYQKINKGFLGDAYIHYAVKANPNAEILKSLIQENSSFDAASIGEIKLLQDLGCEDYRISFGNTIKKEKDILWAIREGISLFAVDSEEEIDKIARAYKEAGEAYNTPEVYVRMLVASTEAEWPLSRKFGCAPSHVVSLMNYAKESNLVVCGISFHVGSQTRHPYMWNDTLDAVSVVWKNALEAGHDVYLLNIGGGFPSFYGTDITDLEEYGQEIREMILNKFGDTVKYLMVEPGRAIVGDAGYIVAEVVLVSKKNPEDDVRWVYLDIGKFSGLSETMEEAIRYEFLVPGKENSEVSDCILAGPTCDSADVLYEKNYVKLPVDLKAGDRFIIRNTGAYTTTYSSVWFNGFSALKEIVVR